MIETGLRNEEHVVAVKDHWHRPQGMPPRPSLLPIGTWSETQSRGLRASAWNTHRGSVAEVQHVVAGDLDVGTGPTEKMLVHLPCLATDRALDDVSGSHNDSMAYRPEDSDRDSKPTTKEEPTEVGLPSATDLVDRPSSAREPGMSRVTGLVLPQVLTPLALRATIRALALVLRLDVVALRTGAVIVVDLPVGLTDRMKRWNLRHSYRLPSRASRAGIAYSRNELSRFTGAWWETGP
jgi:hypothetical protein